MISKLSDIPSSCEIPNSHCYFQYEKNWEIFSGEYPLELILFGWDIDWYSHQGYMLYLAEKIEWFSTNIKANDIRYQGLINCLIKWLIPWGQDKSEKQLENNFQSFTADLEFLYGILWDVPEVLEKSWKPQNISTLKLRQRGESDISEKRAFKKWEKYTTQLLSILNTKWIKSEELESLELQTYCIKAYAKGKTPNKEKLKNLWVSQTCIDMIWEFGTAIKIHAILKRNETLIWEFDDYEIVEMHSIEHLEKESDITGHCVGNSEHYIRKMNKGQVRIFSLRKWDARITLEYDIQGNRFIQMQWSDDSHISLIELEKTLEIFSINWFKNISFEYKEVQELRSKNNFIVWYSDTEDSHSKELIVENFDDISQLENMDTLGGMITLDGSTTKEELDKLCTLPIDLDITKIDPKLKETITQTIGWLVDFSEKIVMNNLESIWWYFDCVIAESVQMRRLQSIWWTFNCKYATRLEVDILESIWWDFNCENMKEIEINNLQSVWWTFDCLGAETIDITNLKSVWWSFYCSYAKTIKITNLKSVWWNFYCSRTRSIQMNNLQSVWWNLNCKYATTLDMNSLESVWRKFHCESAKIWDLSSLTKTEKLILPEWSEVILCENPEFEIEYR